MTDGLCYLCRWPRTCHWQERCCYKETPGAEPGVSEQGGSVCGKTECRVSHPAGTTGQNRPVHKDTGGQAS